MELEHARAIVTVRAGKRLILLRPRKRARDRVTDLRRKRVTRRDDTAPVRVTKPAVLELEHLFAAARVVERTLESGFASCADGMPGAGDRVCAATVVVAAVEW